VVPSIGIENNRKDAIKWYRRAAERGDWWAQNNLGILLLQNNGGAVRRRSGERWLACAAAQGNRDAAYNMGVAWLLGSFGQSDRVMAKHWLAVSAAKGHEQARHLIDDLKTGRAHGEKPEFIRASEPD
jgi:TPR repeat protein